MKTRLLLLFFLFPALGFFAQDIPPPAGGSETSLTPPSTVHRLSSTVTRAVVVGISDYQHNAIPDLRFAHRDAEIFAAWLRSSAGGNVPEDNITLLTNEKATVAAVGTALFAMLDLCKAGDRVIFYFSGHGDVEAKTRSQPGYLLCHDSPANVYMVGALNLRDLQEIVSTLSEKQAAVTLITDACHAGKLAGAGIGGTQATATALSKQFANEVKIMSCQPNEFSLEGEQWGGGRGVFSLNLQEGLTGLADKNGDDVVNLLEITRYLQDEVSAQTAPHSQIPMSTGDLQTTINRVDATALAALKTEKSGAVADISTTGSKGLEDDILAKTDAATREKYLLFKKLSAEHVFFEPEEMCADMLYRQLIKVPDLAPLHGLMSRNYAVALLDEVQQAINALLDNDPYEANHWKFNPEKYREYPAYLRRSIELLGEKHYLRRSLEAKKLYFEGYNLIKNVGELQNQPARRDSFKLAARAKFNESLRLQPEAAYVNYAIAESYSFEINATYQSDSVSLYCQKILETTPGWLLPYLLVATEYGIAQMDYLSAEHWLNKALAIAPNSYVVLERLSWLKQWQNQADSSLAISRRMIAMRPDIFNAYSTAATTLTFIKGDWLESEKYCDQSLALEPKQLWWAYTMQGINYLKTRRTDLAISHFEKGLSLPYASAMDKSILLIFQMMASIQEKNFEETERLYRMGLDEFNNNLATLAVRELWMGKACLLQNRLTEAAEHARLALTVDPTTNGCWSLAWALLAEIEVRHGHPDSAASLFQKAMAMPFAHLGNFYLDEAIFRYGHFLLDQNRPAEAEAQFRELGRILPKSANYAYGLALISAKKGDKTAALDWLEKSLDNFYPDAESIFEESLLKKIRKTKRFREMMAKHFP